MIIIRWIISAFTIIIVSYIVPGIHVASFWSALLVALVLGLLNAVVRPIIILLTLPVTIITLGLFVFVINALLLLLVNAVIKGFTVDGFLPALLGAVVIWFIGWVVNTYVFERGK